MGSPMWFVPVVLQLETDKYLGATWHHQGLAILLSNSNTAEAQENYSKTNARKMIEVLTEEMNKSVKEVPEKHK